MIPVISSTGMSCFQQIISVSSSKFKTERPGWTFHSWRNDKITSTLANTVISWSLKYMVIVSCLLKKFMLLLEYRSYISQHHLKAVGCPVVIAPVVLYSDDTSGNKSKKWNKFDCWCITLAGLPIHEARKFQHIHFLACSNNMPAIHD